MKLLLINAVCGIRSTGRICIQIAQEYKSKGYEVKIAYGRERVPSEYTEYAVKIGNNRDVYFHALMDRLFGKRGEYSRRATKKFLKWADEFNPDVLWLHNIHDYFINIEMLFDWIKSRPDMQVKWTQHDCWAFTGGCFHFPCSCEQWKTHCTNCEGRTSRCDVGVSYEKKKRMFTGIKNMEIIVVSHWLEGLVKQSFLCDYPITVIHNKIDTTVFKPGNKDYFERNSITDKKVVLGVASAWSEKKGLGDFIKLAELLPKDYRIVLVGLTEKQIKGMPTSIHCIKKTNSKNQLAEIYNSSFVFVNPTYQDSYPTVNLEAQACGLPVITYNTGGSPETLGEDKGYVIEQGNVNALAEKIMELGSEN